MKLFKFQTYTNLLSDLKFAIGILLMLAMCSALGSVIEQDQSILFYQETYSSLHPIYGFINADFILSFGLDHVYTTWWFLLLIFLLALCLIACSFTRQFPTFLNSKKYFFKKKKVSFLNLAFFVQFTNFFYIKEMILAKLQTLNFYTYQKGNFLFAYKGLIGRMSPILVHISLLVVLFGSAVGAFQNVKAQEIIVKGELFHVQNPIKIGFLTSLPSFAARINDFWVEYQDNRIHQFYSNVSLLDSFGHELKQQTISVNNPLRYKQIDFYQSDWNLVGVRIQNFVQNNIYELPLFSFQKNPKSWITWLNLSTDTFTLVFDQLQNVFFIYDKSGRFIDVMNVGSFLTPSLKLIEILPSTGLLIKYDPMIQVIYFGFALLMITTFFSYFSFTQFWVFTRRSSSFLGCFTNRSKIQVEVEFENLLRFSENLLRLWFLKSFYEKKHDV